MANRPTDPEMVALLDSAAVWLTMAAMCAQGCALTLPAGIAKMMPRLHTAYYPENERRAAAHLAYSNGLRVAPRRMTAADKAQAEARAWGLAS